VADDLRASGREPADIRVAMGAAGTDTAVEAADVVVMNDDLRRIPETVRLSCTSWPARHCRGSRPRPPRGLAVLTPSP
jgi:hypothetical protein